MLSKPKRWKNKKYLEWVRQQPCVICGRQAEPHHVKGVGGLSGAGLKAPDWATMPLCHDHHMEMHRDSTLWDSQWEHVARTLGRAVDEGVF